MKNNLVPWKKRALKKDGQWDWHPFDLLHQEMNDLFDTYYRGVGKGGRRMAASAGWELSETDEEIRVKAELPGMDEKDIEVSLDENTLIIHAERKEQHEKKKRNYHVEGMSYGSFDRSIALPEEVDGSGVDAKFKRGVLTLTLPKTERAKAERKRIPVHVD